MPTRSDLVLRIIGPKLATLGASTADALATGGGNEQSPSSPNAHAYSPSLKTFLIGIHEEPNVNTEREPWARDSDCLFGADLVAL